MEEKVKELELKLASRSEIVTSLYLKVKQQKSVIEHLEKTKREQDHISMWYAHVVDSLQSELLETQKLYQECKSKYDNLRKELEKMVKIVEK